MKLWKMLLRIMFGLSLSTCATITVATCLNFTFTSESEMVESFCGGMVDYDFFVPIGYSVKELDARAVSYMHDQRLEIMPPSCLAALKKLACSNAFLKCKPGSNFNMYSEFGTLISVPYQRPCEKLCSTANLECLGMLPLLNMTQNCSARYDYSQGEVTDSFGKVLLPYQYDSTNNDSVCNVLNHDVKVSTTMELYAGGVCDGIITELYLPHTTNSESSTPPALYLAPGVMQSLMEAELAVYINSLPVWMSDKCHLAAKKYLCGSKMLRPQLQVMSEAFSAHGYDTADMRAAIRALGVDLEAFLALNFYAPSYPAQSFCLEYINSCSEFLALQSVSSLFKPTCSADVNNSMVKMYPQSNQTVSTLSLAAGAVNLTIAFQTEPNTMREPREDTSFATVCPIGFVIPDDPMDSMVQWHKGSGCAMGCRDVLWSPQEWQFFDSITNTMSPLGLVCIVVLLLLWVLDKTRRKQYLIICFAANSALGTISFVAMASYPGTSGICKNNAVPFVQSDGLNVCTYQTITLVYTGLGCSLSWLMLALDLYLKIVRGIGTEGHRRMHLLIIILGPLPFLLGLLATNSLGKGPSVPWCFFLNNNDLPLFYLPIFIITIVGLAAMSVVISTITKTVLASSQHNNRKVEPSNVSESSGSSSASPSAGANSATTAAPAAAKGSKLAVLKNLKILRTPVIFVMIFLLVMLILFAFRGGAYASGNAVLQSENDWIDCIFLWFDGDNSHWEKICGVHASLRPNINLIVFVMIVGSIQSILITVIFIFNATVPSSVAHALQKYGIIGTKRMAMQSSRKGGPSAAVVGDSKRKSAFHDSEDDSKRKSANSEEISNRDSKRKSSAGEVIKLQDMDDSTKLGKAFDENEANPKL